MSSLRIGFLDLPDEQDVPHLLSEPQPVTSYVVAGKTKDAPYGYLASKTVRRATPTEVEAWRSQAWMAGEGEL